MLREQLLQNEKYVKMLKDAREESDAKEAALRAPKYASCKESLPKCVNSYLTQYGKDLLGHTYLGEHNVQEGNSITSKHIHRRNFDGMLVCVWRHSGLRKWYSREILAV